MFKEFEPDGTQVFENSGAIWDYGKGFIKAYTEDYETKNRLIKISGAQLMCLYSLPNGRGNKPAWDVVMPSKRIKTAVRTLKKSESRS